jgi:hypothetical protein
LIAKNRTRSKRKKESKNEEQKIKQKRKEKREPFRVYLSVRQTTKIDKLDNRNKDT